MNEAVRFRVTVGNKIVGEFDLSQVEYRQMALHRGNKTPEKMASSISDDNTAAIYRRDRRILQKLAGALGITGTSKTAGDEAYARFINASRMRRSA